MITFGFYCVLIVFSTKTLATSEIESWPKQETVQSDTASGNLNSYSTLQKTPAEQNYAENEYLRSTNAAQAVPIIAQGQTYENKASEQWVPDEIPHDSQYLRNFQPIQKQVPAISRSEANAFAFAKSGNPVNAFPIQNHRENINQELLHIEQVPVQHQSLRNTYPLADQELLHVEQVPVQYQSLRNTYPLPDQNLLHVEQVPVQQQALRHTHPLPDQELFHVEQVPVQHQYLRHTYPLPDQIPLSVRNIYRPRGIHLSKNIVHKTEYEPKNFPLNQNEALDSSYQNSQSISSAQAISSSRSGTVFPEKVIPAIPLPSPIQSARDYENSHISYIPVNAGTLFNTENSRPVLRERVNSRDNQHHSYVYPKGVVEHREGFKNNQPIIITIQKKQNDIVGSGDIVKTLPRRDYTTPIESGIESNTAIVNENVHKQAERTKNHKQIFNYHTSKDTKKNNDEEKNRHSKKTQEKIAQTENSENSSKTLSIEQDDNIKQYYEKKSGKNYKTSRSSEEKSGLVKSSHQNEYSKKKTNKNINKSKNYNSEQSAEVSFEKTIETSDSSERSLKSDDAEYKKKYHKLGNNDQIVHETEIGDDCSEKSDSQNQDDSNNDTTNISEKNIESNVSSKNSTDSTDENKTKVSQNNTDETGTDTESINIQEDTRESNKTTVETKKTSSSVKIESDEDDDYLDFSKSGSDEETNCQ